MYSFRLEYVSRYGLELATRIRKKWLDVFLGIAMKMSVHIENCGLAGLVYNPCLWEFLPPFMILKKRRVRNLTSFYYLFPLKE